MGNSNSRRRILIVDDEPSHSEVLCELLSGQFEVFTARDGESGLKLAGELLPDLVLLDVRLPRQSGLSVCSTLRSNQRTRNIPIIVMTGHVTQEARTTAFRMGADDFLSKPFSLDEALARIESKIRRLNERDSRQNVLQLGNLSLDRSKMEASIDGVRLTLSALEFRLLDYFVQNREQILSRDKILKDIWKNAVVTPRTIDTHVSFLRKKLATSRYGIRTLYGAGYILKAPDGSEESGE